MKNLSLILLQISIACIVCDGSVWIRDDDKPIESSAEESAAYVPIEEKPVESSSQPLNTDSSTLDSSSSTEADTSATASSDTTTTTMKPKPKKSGCTNQLWADIKYCWASCSNASTSRFWDTWCFTTKGGENATKVECFEDNECDTEWKCKTSCGLFSPHLDRKEGEVNNTTVFETNEE